MSSTLQRKKKGGQIMCNQDKYLKYPGRNAVHRNTC